MHLFVYGANLLKGVGGVNFRFIDTVIPATELTQVVRVFTDIVLSCRQFANQRTVDLGQPFCVVLDCQLQFPGVALKLIIG